MVNQTANLQDVFLNKARKSGVLLTIHVMNGYQIKNALLKSFDNFCVLVESEGKQIMIYKHAISSITPQKPIELKEKNPDKEVE